MLGVMLAALSFASAGLDGTWRQDCAHGYFREENFEQAAATFTERNFGDAACTKPLIETISRGVVVRSGAVEEPAGAEALDFTFLSVSLKPLEESVAALWRERGACGIRDWELGQEREVTGKECDFAGLGSVLRVPSEGDQRFGVVKEGLRELYFGRLSPERDASSPVKRPRELDPAPYRKVDSIPVQ